MRLTKAQQKALFQVYTRTRQNIDKPDPRRTYLQFRRSAQVVAHMGCVMVEFAGMWLGIEPDGYTHS